MNIAARLARANSYCTATAGEHHALSYAKAGWALFLNNQNSGAIIFTHFKLYAVSTVHRTLNTLSCHTTSNRTSCCRQTTACAATDSIPEETTQYINMTIVAKPEILEAFPK